MTSKTANELELYKECFGHLSEENNIFSQVLHILDVISNSRSGIGEVMQDYAAQAYNQLKDVLNAGKSLISSHQSATDMEVLHNAGNVLRMINKFLELAPAAMQRNYAETIGKEKISRSDIEHMYRVFSTATETKLLLTYEAPPEEPYEYQSVQA